MYSYSKKRNTWRFLCTLRIFIFYTQLAIWLAYVIRKFLDHNVSSARVPLVVRTNMIAMYTST